MEQVEIIILWKNNLRTHRVDFAAFSRAIRNWWEKPCISHMVKFTIRCESDGGKVPIFWGKNRYQFPRLSQFHGFRCSFPCYGKSMENPIIAHIIKCTTGCESNRKKAPILWGKYEYEFPRFPTYDGFCRIYPGTNFIGFSHSMGFPAISHAMGDWWENPCISHMMKYTTGWEYNGKKAPILWKKYWNQFR